jgi:hypothetical protein
MAFLAGTLATGLTALFATAGAAFLAGALLPAGFGAALTGAAAAFDILFLAIGALFFEEAMAFFPDATLLAAEADFTFLDGLAAFFVFIAMALIIF